MTGYLVASKKLHGSFWPSVAGTGYVNASQPCYRYMGWGFPDDEADELRKLVHEYRERVSVEWPATFIPPEDTA
jgi:hypothetical protein